MPGECNVFWAGGAGLDLLAIAVLYKNFYADEPASVFDFDDYAVYACDGG